ncbi:hypothetical protein [Amycolatopsis sp. NPDC004169]
MVALRYRPPVFAVHSVGAASTQAAHRSDRLADRRSPIPAFGIEEIDT